MENNDFNRTAASLMQEISQIEEHAQRESETFKNISKEIELLKIMVLEQVLGKRRKSLARRSGVSAVFQDKKKAGIALASAVAGMIVGGIAGGDRVTAGNYAMLGLDSAVQGLGNTEWMVSLDKDLLVAPKDTMSGERAWVTLESFLGALDTLAQMPVGEDGLGDLNSVISRVKELRKAVRVILTPVVKNQQSKTSR